MKTNKHVTIINNNDKVFKCVSSRNVIRTRDSDIRNAPSYRYIKPGHGVHASQLRIIHPLQVTPSQQVPH